jgi:transposase
MMRCSSDLRRRVVKFIKEGGGKREAALRFGVGEASIYPLRRHPECKKGKWTMPIQN